MALAQEDLEYIKSHLGEWLAERSLGRPPVVYEIELRERMVRAEEALVAQRALMQQGFEQIDRRFEQMQQALDQRFEQIDKRFEQIDKRFELMQQALDKRFEQIDKRFEQVEKRFEQIDKRFELMQQAMDRRFDEMLRRHDRQFLWLVGFIASSAGLLLAAIRYL